MRRATFERTPKSLLIGIGVTLLGGALWGVNATVSKILMSDYGADPLWIASIRQLCAGMLFLAAAGRDQAEAADRSRARRALLPRLSARRSSA